MLLQELQNERPQKAFQVSQYEVGRNQDVRPPSLLFLEYREMARQIEEGRRSGYDVERKKYMPSTIKQSSQGKAVKVDIRSHNGASNSQ